MKGSNQINLVLIFIALAVNVAFIGVGITCAIFYYCAQNQIDITQRLWLVGIPPAAALVINVGLIELYLKISRRN